MLHFFTLSSGEASIVKHSIRTPYISRCSIVTECNEGTGKVVPVLNYAMKNSALDGCEWSASLPQKRAPGTLWIGGWVGPKVSLDASDKMKMSPF
jgi:hypothetical protein